MQKTLDLSIKKYETGSLDGGYLAPNGKTYPNYMANQAWQDFKADMENNHPAAYGEYGAGSGGELKDKGNFPPKMASYGSSSRMIYNLFKDIPNFRFEYKLPTCVGGIANLDGYLEKAGEHIFIEAKCREPYGEKSHLIESKYKDLYYYVNNDKQCNLNIKAEDAGSKINVVFSVGHSMISFFDIKQMICHLLGIAVKFLNEPSDKNISFLYLCYNPKLIEITDKKKEYGILHTYEKMCAECHSIDFRSLFRTVLIYLSKELNIGHLSVQEIDDLTSRFIFVLCDQRIVERII